MAQAEVTLKLPQFGSETFGQRLRLIRLDLKWSSARMARELDVPISTYRTWEVSDVSPHIGRETIARRVREEHGYDEEWLLHGSAKGTASEQPKQPSLCLTEVAA